MLVGSEMFMFRLGPGFELVVVVTFGFAFGFGFRFHSLEQPTINPKVVLELEFDVLG